MGELTPILVSVPIYIVRVYVCVCACVIGTDVENVMHSTTAVVMVTAESLCLGRPRMLVF